MVARSPSVQLGTLAGPPGRSLAHLHPRVLLSRAVLGTKLLLLRPMEVRAGEGAWSRVGCNACSLFCGAPPAGVLESFDWLSPLILALLRKLNRVLTSNAA